jgi:hypothetical protein
MRVQRLLLPVLLAAAPVRAHSLSNELALGLYQNSPNTPQSAYVADQLTFRFDLDDAWILKLGGTFTYDGETPPEEGAVFGTSSAQVLGVVGGLEYEASPRVDLYLDVSGSPSASQRFGTTLPPANDTTPGTEIQVHNASSSVGALLGASFVIGGTEFLETILGGTTLDVSVGWTLMSTHQRLDAAVNPKTGQPVSGSTFETICKIFPNTRGCQKLRTLLKGGTDTINQFVLSASVLQPVGGSTDLGLSASVYVYDQDPLSASFFTNLAQQLTSLGGGFPLAPQRWSISPMLEQRIGNWSISLWYQYLQYVSDQSGNDYGQAHVAGLRVSVKIGTAWTVWVAGSLQWDLLNNTPPMPAGTTLLTSGRVAVGFRASF